MGVTDEREWMQASKRTVRERSEAGVEMLRWAWSAQGATAGVPVFANSGSCDGSA